jgi:hypothetical protein
MRNLIAQRPNLVPVGLGHSGTGISAGVIMPAHMDADADADADLDADVDVDELEEDVEAAETFFTHWDTSPDPDSLRHKRTFSEIASNDEEVLVGSGDDYEPSSPMISESGLPAERDPKAGEQEEEEVQEDADEYEEDAKPKIKAKGKETHRKNSAKPSKSTPAAAAPAVKAPKKSKLAEFSDIAKSEERTRQKELELTALRTRQAIKATEVKGRVVEKREDRRLEAERGKREEKMAKLRMKELKMIQSHELRMAGRGAVTSHGRTAGTFFDDTRSSSSGSHYAPSEPPSYAARFDFDSFSGNAAAGLSSAASTSANQDFTLPVYNPDHEDESSLALGAYLAR